jgi:hypothetical protein
VNFRTAFCACVGPALGVDVNPEGDVKTIGALLALMVVTPSIATMSGLMALLPQSPGKSPFPGMNNPPFTV